MRRGLEHALNECLSQLNTGELGLEEVLARYPEHEAELRPLLRTAMLVRQVPQAVPSPQAKAAGRQRLLAAVARKRREKVQARPGLLRRLGQSAAILVQPLVQPQRQPLRLAQAIAVLLVIVSLISAGTVAVAAGSLPDSPLYPIKLTTERVQLALTTTPAGKARLHITYSERRLQEARTLWEAGKGLSEATVQAIKSENVAARTAIGRASEQERPNLWADFALLTEKQQKALEEMKSKVPPSDLEAIEEALEAIEEHQSVATEAMTALLTPTPAPRPTDTPAVYVYAETLTPGPTATPVLPTFTPTPVRTVTPAPPTATPVPTPTAQAEVPFQPGVEATATNTPQAEVPFQPTVGPVVEPSPTLTATPTLTPTVTLTATPTPMPTATPAPTPTVEPTATPTSQAEVPFQPGPAASITNCRVSDAPRGDAVSEFPAGTRTVYIVFDFAYMAGEEVEIRVYNNVGHLLLREVRTLSGEGTASIAFRAGEGGFAPGRYLVNFYHLGGVIRTIIWDVTET